MNLKVLCYGEVVIDLIQQDRESIIYKVGGAPLNVAAGLKRLGVDSILVSSVGADWFGKIAVEYLKSNKIKYYVETKSDIATRTAIISHDDHNERYFEFSPGIAAENSLPIKKLEFAKRFKPDVFYFGSLSFAKGATLNVFKNFVSRLRSRGVKTLFDPNLRLDLFHSPSDAREKCRKLAALSDVIRLNAEEIFFLTNTQNNFSNRRRNIERAVKRLYSLGPRNIFITDGERGSYLYHNGSLDFCPSFEVESVDTTGCGDAFTAAMIEKFFSRGRNIDSSGKDILSWSNAAGALAATKLGGADSMPAKIEIERFIKSYIRQSDGFKKRDHLGDNLRGKPNYFSTRPEADEPQAQKTKKEHHMKKVKRSFWSMMAVLLMGILFGPLNILAQTNYTLKQIASFEGNTPSFWNIGNQPSGSTLTWATDQFVSMGHSIKIQKNATSDSAAWVSDNMCDIWSPTVPANVDLLFGAWVKTSGVNTNPTSDDQRWYIAYTFYDSAGSLIGTIKLPINQTQATSGGWMADTTAVGQVSLPKNAWKMVLSFVGGKNATGTVWADNFIFTGRNGAWAGQDWNTSLGVPTGWYYWLPPNGGNDGLINSGFENTLVTNTTAHTGNYSLEFNMPAGRDAHDGFVSTHRLPFSAIDPTIKPGDIIQISVWIKGSNLVPDSAAAHPTTWSVGITPQFFTKLGNNDGFDGTGNDYNFTFPNVTSFDWTKYTVDVPVPTNPATSGMEIRLHVYSTFTGTVYFDDISVTKISNPTFSEVAGFESDEPAFWYMGNNPGNSIMSWATDQSLSMGHSLKIQKGVTSDTAAWVSENMCDIWSPNVPANVDLLFGAWVKTSGVNTNPTSDDQRWYIAYTFYDTLGTLIGTIKLPINQSQATSSGWIADTTAVGQVSLPKDAYKMILSFVGGRNATGTVWADNFIFTGRNGAWAGQDWNTSLGVPTGWYYWLPPNGGNDGLINSGFENTLVTNATAHTGNYSLEFNMPAGRDTHDGFVSTHRMPFTYIDSTITPGGYVRVGVWIKASNLLPDSAAAHPGQWGVGITPQFFTKLGNNDGFDGTGPDSVFTLPSVTSFDWTHFYVYFQVPNDKAYTGMEVRLHIYSLFTGTVYFDDMTVEGSPTGVKEIGKLIPATFEVFQNYPNPFNPTTTISYALPNPSLVKVVIYDILGREVKTLIDDKQGPGVHNIIWDGLNNSGQQVASGTYIYRVTAGSNVQVKKMLFLK